MEKEMGPVIEMTVNWKHRAAAREKAVRALADLEPVYRLWAEFIPQEAYEYKGDQGEADLRNARWWAAFRATGEHTAVKNALADYLRYTVAKNEGVTGFIVANDQALTVSDLYSQCVEHVLGRLPQTLRNVSAAYASKKGQVDKAEGCLLYIDRSVCTYLIDQARKIDSLFGRREKREADPFLQEGRPLLCAEELRVGDTVIRRGGCPGTYTGREFHSGSPMACFTFADGCRQCIPWDIVPSRVRRFTGNVQAIPALETGEDRKAASNRPLSLDALVGDGEEGIAWINMLPCGKSGEETLLENEMRDVVRRTYLSTLRGLQEDFAKAIMLCYYVHDCLCLEFTHCEDICRRMEEEGPLALLSRIHEGNCAIMALASSEALQVCNPHQEPYSIKQLTLAKHQAKKLLRRNMTAAMAA